MGILAHPMFLQKYYGLSRLRSLLNCKKKALVMDDEADTRKVLALLLKQQGYECEEARDAFAAIRWLEHNHADLVTTDIHQGWCMEEKGKRIPPANGHRIA